MTRDEVKKQIADVLFFQSPAFTKKRQPCYRSEFDEIAEAVLAAFAARGVVLGERATLNDEQDAWMESQLDDRYSSEIFADFGIALVRVVPND